MQGRQKAWIGAVAVAGLAMSLTAASAAANAADAASLSGTWQIRSLGEFRRVEIQQEGSKLEAHRELWPEFEGEKYKLEHQYRGRIAGTALKGQLFVREDGKGPYEPLRPFTGSIEADGTIILDGMPMQRHN